VTLPSQDESKLRSTASLAHSVVLNEVEFKPGPGVRGRERKPAAFETIRATLARPAGMTVVASKTLRAVRRLITPICGSI
jgi:hypothetical protein